MTEKNYITPQMYGAVGDGVTDDTEAINTMFESAKDGDTIYYPNGTYLVSRNGTASITENAIKIIGKNNIKIEFSNGAKIKCALDASGAMADFGILYVKDCSNIEITGGTIEGEGDEHQNGLNIYYAGIETGLTTSQAAALEGAIAPYYIASTGKYYDMNGGINGIEIRDCNNVYIHNMTIHNCFGDGILAITVTKDSPQMKNYVTENCTIYNCKRNGIAYEGIKNGVIRNCFIYNINGYSPQAGIDLESEKSQLNENILIDGCQIYDCGLKAIIQSTRTYDVTVSNCKSNCPLIVGNKSGDNLHILNSTFTYINLTHNSKVDNCKFNTIGVYPYQDDDGTYEYATAEINNCEILGSTTNAAIHINGKKETVNFNNCIIHYLAQEEGRTHRLLSWGGIVYPSTIIFNDCDFLISNTSQAIIENAENSIETLDFIKCRFIAKETISKCLFVAWCKYAKIIDCIFDFQKVESCAGMAWDSLITLKTDTDGIHYYINNKFITKETETPLIKYLFNLIKSKGKAYFINNFTPTVIDIYNPTYVAGTLVSHGNITSATVATSE